MGFICFNFRCVNKTIYKLVITCNNKLVNKKI